MRNFSCIGKLLEEQSWSGVFYTMWSAFHKNILAEFLAGEPCTLTLVITI